MKRTALKIVRLVVSGGLILYLIFKLDLSDVGRNFRALSPIFVVGAGGLIFMMVLTNSLRWQTILKSKHIRLPYWRLVYFYLVGIFFSSFLPTSVGGDFARVVAVAAETDRRADAFASVIVERFLGFFVLLPVALFSLPFVRHEISEWKLLAVVGLVAIAVFVVAYLMLLRPVAKRFAMLIDPVLGMLGRFRARERLEKAYEAIVDYSRFRGTILVAFGLSLIARLLWIASCYLVAQSLEIRLSFMALLLVVPVVEILRMIPISISGLGVREAAFVGMLRQFGVEDSRGFTLAVIIYVIFFLFGILGGILYGTRQFLPKGDRESM